MDVDAAAELPGPEIPPEHDSNAMDPEGASASAAKPSVIDHPHLQLAASDIVLLSAMDENQQRTRFTVRRAGLCAYSTVLRDMFDTSSENIQDGELPQVVLTDSPGGLADLLSFMFANETTIKAPAWRTRSVSELLAVLSLADKYGVVNLQTTLEASLSFGLESMLNLINFDGWKLRDERDFSIYETIIDTLAYADKVNNEPLADLALRASYIVLEETDRLLEYIDLNKCKDLLPPTERKLWQHHCRKRQQRYRELEADHSRGQSQEV